MVGRQDSEASERTSGPEAHSCAEKRSEPETIPERESCGMTTSDVLNSLLRQAQELRESFATYLIAKGDRAKLSLRNTLVWMVVAALGFVTLGGLLITASWFLLNGIAGGLSVLCGDRLWIGNILAGIAAAGGLGLGIYWAVARRMRSSRKETIRKYEERKTRRRTECGQGGCEPPGESDRADE